MIYLFAELKSEERARAGGKGAVLAQLYQLGFRVPNGFVITAEAFEGESLRSEAWEVVRRRLAQLRAEGARTFAVRSSALREDGAVASFAGGFESVLDVQSNAEVRQAIGRVYASREGERVQAYSQAHRLGGEHQMAVVVQRLVQAELSGVLFTADPVTGSHAMMIGNAIYGLGEQLVSGEVNPLSFTLQRPKGTYDGPADTSSVSTSLEAFAAEFYRLGQRLQKLLGGPQDIEWAIADGRLYLLQSRPITTLQAHNPVTGEWNDSHLGDYLWTNTNFGEALPDVMTPFTWSIMQVYLKNNALGIETEHFPLGGNIGGRLYMNVSLFVSLIESIGLRRQKMLRLVTEMFGTLPPESNIPTIQFSRWHFLSTLAPHLWRRFWLVKQQKKQVPAFIAKTPALVAELSAEIEAAQTKSKLLALWKSRLQAHLDEACQMLAAGTSDYKNLSRQLHIELEELVGEADANALLSGVSSEDNDLASLGPLLGLTKVAQGEMSREEYIQHYGHRGTHELELSKPRPIEEVAWIEHIILEMRRNPIDVQALLTKQRKQHQSAWERLKVQHPHKANSLRQRLNRMAEASKSREATRSEVVRLFGIFRAFALRIGALTGLKERIFFLSLPEQLALLAGDKSSSALVSAIPARQESYARYSALPPYPTLIKGRFDPFRWAADPQPRHDIFDAELSSSQKSGAEESTQTTITGFAGAAGIVEGTVCILHSVAEGHKLTQRASENAILVTTTTNIGWTPLFPRAAAIITDVGAPLSHAAIVARELGIPAVVGCANATMLLKDGDRVRVNGGAGIVQKL